jgi:hypothetical protein
VKSPLINTGSFPPSVMNSSATSLIPLKMLDLRLLHVNRFCSPYTMCSLRNPLFYLQSGCSPSVVPRVHHATALSKFVAKLQTVNLCQAELLQIALANLIHLVYILNLGKSKDWSKILERILVLSFPRSQILVTPLPNPNRPRRSLNHLPNLLQNLSADH